MAIAIVEVQNIFGIRRDDRFISSPWRVTNQDSADLRKAIKQKGILPVPRVAPLALISATMASIVNGTEVQEAMRQLAGTDEAVVAYLAQTAKSLKPVSLNDRLVCDARVINVRPKIQGKAVNQLTFQTDVLRGEENILTLGDKVASGIAVVRIFCLKPDSLPEEKVGVFANLDEIAQEVLQTNRGSDRFVTGSPYFLVTEETISLFAQGSKDFNDLHLNPKQAKRSPFKGRIAHGMLPVDWFLEGLGLNGQEIDAKMRFLGPLYPGDIIGSDAQSRVSNGTSVLSYQISKVTNLDPHNLVEKPVIKGTIASR